MTRIERRCYELYVLHVLNSLGSGEDEWWFQNG